VSGIVQEMAKNRALDDAATRTAALLGERSFVGDDPRYVTAMILSGLARAVAAQAYRIDELEQKIEELEG
jgi:hypothetical protein